MNELHTQVGDTSGTIEYYVIYPKLNYLVLLRVDVTQTKSKLTHSQFFLMT